MSSEWVDFLDQINSTIRQWDKDGCDFPVFRGHSDQTWNLEPSLMRLKKDLDKDEYDRLESALYFDFVTYSARYSRQNSSWEVLFEMRHHGLPTRLLDWSESFAMSLFFALSENAPSPTIWMLNPYELNEIGTRDGSLINPIGLSFNYEDGFLNEAVARTEIDDGVSSKPVKPPFEFPIAIVPPLSSERLFAQKGLFTLQGKGNDTPLDQENGLTRCLRKFVIPINALKDAQAFIQLSGVNDFTAYPDLDGLSRYLMKKYKITEMELREVRFPKRSSQVRM